MWGLLILKTNAKPRALHSRVGNGFMRTANFLVDDHCLRLDSSGFRAISPRGKRLRVVLYLTNRPPLLVTYES
jgi:hypothetical protein